jgi:NAD+ kinase
MTIALVLHPTRKEAAEIGSRALEAAERHGIGVTVDPVDAGRVAGATVAEDGADGADLILAVGGDGTVLEAVRRGIAADVPILGVNVGRIGFLTEVEPDRVDQAVDAFAAGDYHLSSRMTLSSKAPDGSTDVGLNDTVLEKIVSQHVVDLAVAVGDERLVEYRADGVVVATPTGSTAYTFSAGGPLVHPELEALIVTAIAPHTLFGRPLVLSPDAELLLTVRGERPGRVNVDGREQGVVEPGEQVMVRRHATPARLVHLTSRSFTATVRQKFRLDDA